MELTKYEHACFVIEKEGKSVIVDPGSFTTDLTVPENVIAVVITHEHGDHFDTEQLGAIIDKNPAVVIMGPLDVTAKLAGFETRTVRAGDNFTIEGIEFEFYGGDHAVIHPSIPLAQNVGVMIDERVYYPGDSFTIPEKSVDALALPVSAPWLKLSDAIDFLLAVAPRLAFPTHDAILSTAGQGVVDRMIGSFATAHDIDYQRIDSDTIEIE